MTEYVRYPWSPTVYSVTYTSPEWTWTRLDYGAWAAAGYPAPRYAGYIHGTTYHTYASSPELFALGEDGSLHKMTYEEWAASGFKAPVARPDGFYKTHWSPAVYRQPAAGQPGPQVTAQEWHDAGQPTPRIVQTLPGAFFWVLPDGREIHYAAGGTTRHLSYEEWTRAGSPVPGHLWKAPDAPTISLRSGADDRPLGYEEWVSLGSPAPTVLPPWAVRLPAATTQAVRTVRTDRWCSTVYCTVTEAWSRDLAGHWTLLREFRSQIGPTGFSDPELRREGDRSTPAGVYDVVTTFSTDSSNPGIAMPWKRRLPTSTVSGLTRWYNTWIEEPGRTDGTRASMRWGLWVNFNNGRLVPDQGPAPVLGKGAGIFLHTMPASAQFQPSEGCIAIGVPDQVRWIVTWLDPAANPRIVNGS